MNEKKVTFFVFFRSLTSLNWMHRPRSLRARGGSARFKISQGGKKRYLLPPRAVPSALLEQVHLQQQQPPMMIFEMASSSSSKSSTSATSNSPLNAAVSAATDLLFSSSTPAAAPSLTTDTYESDDGAGVSSALEVAAAIERDFRNDYFLTGKISGRAYSRDCAFVDPTVSVSGLRAWRENIRLLSTYLNSPRIELAGKVEVVSEEEGLRAEGDFASGDALFSAAAASSSSSSNSEEAAASDQQKRHSIVARWRLVAPVSLLPWRPVVDVQGVTVYRLEGEGSGSESESGSGGGGGKEEEVEKELRGGALSPSSPSSSSPSHPRVVVARHTESWGTSPGAAVAQLLVPGRRR